MKLKNLRYLFYCSFFCYGLQSKSDPAAVHGMLLFGSEKIYLSHLPMFHRPHEFHKPHAYQVLLEVTFPSGARETYLKDRLDHPSELVYTFVPRPFILPDLKNQPFALEGSVFRGHFERGGKEIVPDLKTGVPKILSFKKLDGNESRPPNPTYLLFGTASELFIAHLITGRPNFDHIAAVSFAGAINPIPENKSMVTMSVPEVAGDTSVEEVFRTPVLIHETQSSRILSTLKSIYLERDELK